MLTGFLYPYDNTSQQVCKKQKNIQNILYKTLKEKIRQDVGNKAVSLCVACCLPE